MNLRNRLLNPVKRRWQDGRQDVWHLHTAHTYETTCFLVMDFPFHNKFQQSSKRAGFPELRSKPMLPSELGAELGLRPIHSFIVSYQNQKFGVRHDLHVPTQQRRPRSGYRRDA
jgi:hypothetical protein